MRVGAVVGVIREEGRAREEKGHVTNAGRAGGNKVWDSYLLTHGRGVGAGRGGRGEDQAGSGTFRHAHALASRDPGPTAQLSQAQPTNSDTCCV